MEFWTLCPSLLTVIHVQLLTSLTEMDYAHLFGNPAPQYLYKYRVLINWLFDFH